MGVVNERRAEKLNTTVFLSRLFLSVFSSLLLIKNLRNKNKRSNHKRFRNSSL